jgi:hypothetical protein
MNKDRDRLGAGLEVESAAHGSTVLHELIPGCARIVGHVELKNKAEYFLRSCVAVY